MYCLTGCDSHGRLTKGFKVVCHGFNVARRPFQNVEQLRNSALERGLAQEAA